MTNEHFPERQIAETPQSTADLRPALDSARLNILLPLFHAAYEQLCEKLRGMRDKKAPLADVQALIEPFIKEFSDIVTTEDPTDGDARENSFGFLTDDWCVTIAHVSDQNADVPMYVVSVCDLKNL